MPIIAGILTRCIEGKHKKGSRVMKLGEGRARFGDAGALTLYFVTILHAL
jgi:hypothetical protein